MLTGGGWTAGGGEVGAGGLVAVAAGPAATNSALSNQISRWPRHCPAPVKSAEAKTVIWLPVAVASTVNCCQLPVPPPMWGEPAPPQTISASFHKPLPLGSIPARTPMFTSPLEGAGYCSLEARPVE